MPDNAIIVYIIDITGSCLSIPLNAFLVLTIFKTSNAKLQPYDWMFLVNAVFDLFFSGVELICQHQLFISDGMFIVLPHGIEHNIPFGWTYFIFTIHCFTATHGLNILPALYRFRYFIILRGRPPITILFKNLGISVTVSLLIGLGLPYGAYQSRQRGNEHYLNFLRTVEGGDEIRKYFLYVCDIRDFATAFSFFLTAIAVSISFLLCGYYVWKAWNYVRLRTDQLSAKTRSLQRQFTRSLVLQTASALLFAVLPMTIATIAMIFRLNVAFLGLGVMVPLSWLPTANALITLYCVKNYRHYILQLMCCCCNVAIKKVIPSSDNVPTAMPKTPTMIENV